VPVNNRRLHFVKGRISMKNIQSAVNLIALTLLAMILTACGAPAGEADLPPAQVAQTQPAAEDAAVATVIAPTDSATTTPATETTSTVATDAPATAEPLTTSVPAEVTAAPFNPEETPLRLVPIATGLQMPVFLTHAGDGSGRLFVLEKVGRIRIIADGSVVPTPFLDISDKVGSSGSEQGLLGLAFAPDYATSGVFFVDYTDKAGNTVISRFSVTDDPMLADPASESLVLTYPQPASNHNGGMILFGPDGMLWVGTGDGGAANDRFGNGQNPQTLLGKMLRIDVTTNPAEPYTIPADNPWLNAQWNGQPTLPEIWAVGMRNPWRYSFDAATGDLWIADVGQNAYEEVNLIPAGSAGGLNFGWPIMEGLHCFQTADCDPSGLVIPIIEYEHSGNCSITGGYVYRGETPELQGVYFYADYCSMRIWAAIQGNDGAWNDVQVLQGESSITSWGEDEAGELYVVEAGGRISRLTTE
jgi:glucose/arabinose dehydrogenase